MIQRVHIQEATILEDYAAYYHLQPAVQDLRAHAQARVSRLQGRTVWMVNSTAQGGGVAEMLPKLVSLLRELGLRTEWLVIHPGEQRFFSLTKQVHNLVHGAGRPALSEDDRACYARVSRDLADACRDRIGPDDLLVIHDPQPLGMGALLKQELGVRVVWRCHIGLDEENEQTRAAWAFLAPWIQAYDQTVFSLQAYVPPLLNGQAAIIPPAIDPLSHKNRDLSVHKLTGVLANAALDDTCHPVLTPAFTWPARRLVRGGTFVPASEASSIGLQARPTVTQVSRWDRLKGFVPLLQGFARLKAQLHQTRDGIPERHRRRLELVRLILAGPDPDSVQDDPEGLEVFREVCDTWEALPPEVQEDVAVLVLPMQSRKHNALIVNALQRCSTVVVQNSLREGFGLTATEAMWKSRPVLGTHAAGLRAQIHDGVHGCLIRDPEDPHEIAAMLDAMLSSPVVREIQGRNAQRRVAEEYLVLAQVRRWLDVLCNLAVLPASPA